MGVTVSVPIHVATNELNLKEESDVNAELCKTGPKTKLAPIFLHECPK